MENPFWEVNAEFHPPDRVILLFTVITESPDPVYVPIATIIVSPAVALPMAALIVKQGEAGNEQELVSFPEGETYQAAFSRLKSTAGSPLAEARTVYAPN